MADEPTLPRIPPSKAAEAIFGPARKRARFDLRGDLPAQLLSNSSDPAVFSSDDDPALDNYAPDRRKKKKRYVGAWFAQHPASTDSAFDDFIERAALAEPAERAKFQDTRGPMDTESAASAVSPRVMTLPLSPARPRQKKRTFERQYDSGVWMGSGAAGDMGDEGEDGPQPEAAAESPPPASLSSTSSQLSLAPPPPPPPQTDFPPPPPRQRRIFQRVPSLAVNGAEKRARTIIQECIEAGDEEISLIGLGLNSLSNATVEPLSGLVPIPVVAEGVAFEQKEPRLQIFLSANELTCLPGALFNLDHLTVLSLRGNGLRELPPAIGQLRNLQSLNVSLNKLRYLPAELLPLLHTYGQGGRLTELLAHPNRYHMPDEGASSSEGTAGQEEEEEEEDNDGDGDDDGRVSGRSSEKRRKAGLAAAQWRSRPPRIPFARPTRVARSRVRYMDSTGKTWSDFAMELGASGLIATEDLAVAPTPPWSTLPHLSRGADRLHGKQGSSGLTASRVPTLMELALEACYGVPQLGQLAELLPSDAPPQLARQLARARALREAGGAACSLCRWQPLVAPMTEWLEWWEFAKSDINVSYLSSSSSSAAAAPAAAPAATLVAATEDTLEAAVVSPDDVELLPFRWRGCSWGCVPAGKKEDEAKEEGKKAAVYSYS